MQWKPSGVVTLTTDFGLSDHFVGAMKGVMLRINPNLRFVDVSHQIPPQDIPEASFCLRSSYFYFPAGTIHLAVVDPGVGSGRRSLVVVTRDYLFVGPDNGLFSFTFSDPSFLGAYELKVRKYFLTSRGATFHGRDIFAPVAAWLSAGIPPQEMGPPVGDMVRLPVLQPRVGASDVEGEIVHIDRFGNLISNVTEEVYGDLAGRCPGRRIRIAVSAQEIEKIVRCYDEGCGEKPLALFNSSSLLEIFCKGSSAAKRLAVGKGGRIHLYAA